MLRWCLDAALLILRIVTYPFRWLALVFVRLVRLCAAILPPVLLSAASFYAIVWLESNGCSVQRVIQPIEQYLQGFIWPGHFVQLLGLVGSAAVFGWALKKLGTAAWEEVGEMWDLIVETLGHDWWPDFEIVDSLEEIWDHLTEAWDALIESWGSFGRMSLVILAATPVLLMLIAVHLGLMIWRAASLVDCALTP